MSEPCRCLRLLPPQIAEINQMIALNQVVVPQQHAVIADNPSLLRLAAGQAFRVCGPVCFLIGGGILGDLVKNPPSLNVVVVQMVIMSAILIVAGFCVIAAADMVLLRGSSSQGEGIHEDYY
jgi:hypothetical protein